MTDLHPAIVRLEEFLAAMPAEDRKVIVDYFVKQVAESEKIAQALTMIDEMIYCREESP